jgi:hypothetical protein
LLLGGSTSTSQALSNLLTSGSTQGAFLVNLSGGVVSPLTLVPQYLQVPSFQTVNRSVESGGGDNSMLTSTPLSPPPAPPPPVRMTPLPLPQDVNRLGEGVPNLQEDGSAAGEDMSLFFME